MEPNQTEEQKANYEKFIEESKEKVGCLNAIGTLATIIGFIILFVAGCTMVFRNL
jgi:hypothetical protein